MATKKPAHANKPVALAISILGSQEKLGKAIGVTQPAVFYLLHMEGPLPAKHAKPVETATKGQVPRWMWRPDLWDAPKQAKRKKAA